MTTRARVSALLLDDMFQLPDHVRITHIDRIPVAGMPGGFEWLMTLDADEGGEPLPEGEVMLVQRYSTIETSFQPVSPR